MNQTRRGSAWETTVQLGVGFFVSFMVWMFVATPILGIAAGINQSLGITLLFTVTSWIRSFAIRRWFNARTPTSTG